MSKNIRRQKMPRGLVDGMAFLVYNKRKNAKEFSAMNEFWNLDPMYKGFDDPAFEADLTAAKAKMEETPETSQSVT